MNRDQPPHKKKKVEPNSDWLASDVGDIHDIDLEVYGTQIDEMNTTSKITSYNFEVCDSILNVGPCGHVAMGQPAFLSEELAYSTKADPDVELVSTSGHGKNGALCVLQQTVRPQVCYLRPFLKAYFAFFTWLDQGLDISQVWLHSYQRVFFWPKKC